MKILFFLLGLFFSEIYAQHIPYCGFDKTFEKQNKIYPHYIKDQTNTYQFLLQNVLKKRNGTADTLYIIRVVFHVLYNNDDENIPDSFILSQLKVLNEDFRRKNEDTSKTRSIFYNVASDPQIQFVLANKDPNGDSTNGIIRKFTPRSSFSNGVDLPDDVKFNSQGGDNAWDTDLYLNIWIADISYNGNELLLGYAYPPSGHPFWSGTSAPSKSHEGVVLYYKIVGENNPLTNNAAFPINTMIKGRVATHEVGHYLGLRHLWGDPISGQDGCSSDDQIDDTPNQKNASFFTCQLGKNSCESSNPEDLPDMIENYMDYSDELCQNMFSKGQVNVMKNAIQYFRPLIVTEKIILPTSTALFENKLYYSSSTNSLEVKLDENSANLGYSLKLFDISGRCVYSLNQLNKEYLTINTLFLTKGIYIAKLYLNNQATQMTIKWYNGYD